MLLPDGVVSASDRVLDVAEQGVDPVELRIRHAGTTASGDVALAIGLYGPAKLIVALYAMIIFSVTAVAEELHSRHITLLFSGDLFAAKRRKGRPVEGRQARNELQQLVGHAHV
jgi:hypothetical protein